MLELGRDLVANTLELRPHLGRTLVRVTGQGVEIFLVSHFLLFLLNFERTDVLLELALVNSVVIFTILELYLCLFLKLG